MGRRFETVSYTLDSTLSDTPKIPFADWAGAGITIPNGSSITLLTFHAAPDIEGVFEPLYTSANAAVTRTVAADRSYAFPDECFGFGAIRIVPNADGAVEISFKA
jgi:hypothetical protein